MEEHFKNKLKNHRVDWDKEELLGNLKQELARDKSKFNWRWLFLLPLLCLGTCWGVNQLEFSNGEVVVQQDLAVNEIEDSGIGHKKAAQSDLDQKDMVIQKSVNNLEKKRIGKANESALELFISTSNQIAQTSKASLTIFENNEPPNFINEENQNRNLPSANFQTNNNFGKNDGTNSEERNLNSIGFLPLLKMKALSNEKEETEIPKEQKLDLKKIIPIKEPVDFKNSFYASCSADIGMVFRNTNLMNDNLESNTPFRSKERTITASGLKFGYQHKSGLSLESGFEYTEIREFLKVDLLLGRDTFLAPNRMGDFLLTPNLDTVFLDSMTVFESTYRKIRHNNKHTFLSIPLQLSFRKAIGRTDLFGTVGVSYAFFHDYGGREILLGEGNTDVIFDDLDFNFKNRIGVQLGVGVEYPIFNKTRGFINLNYRRSPTLLFFDNAEQFYNSVSLGAGAQYSIGGK